MSPDNPSSFSSPYPSDWYTTGFHRKTESSASLFHPERYGNDRLRFHTSCCYHQTGCKQESTNSHCRFYHDMIGFSFCFQCTNISKMSDYLQLVNHYLSYFRVRIPGFNSPLMLKKVCPCPVNAAPARATSWLRTASSHLSRRVL